MKNKSVLIIILLMVAAAFVAGIVNLFHIRFQRGDIYPAYSSLRTDPLGTKILYEGLDSIRGVSADRNYQPFHKLTRDPGMTYLLLGMHTKAIVTFTKKQVEHLESIAAAGGRIVMTFLPAKESSRKCVLRNEEPCDAAHDAEDNTADDADPIDEEGETDHHTNSRTVYADLEDRWGAAIEYDDSDEPFEYGTIKGSLIADRYPLPAAVSWHSPSYFKVDNTVWTVIYALDSRPVLIERDFGKGKIILATDSYFVSNEAMLKERYPDLLSWIVGKNRTILFDETHFGIVEQPNLAALARKYRLHGLFAAFLFLAALFIWKNTAGFIPPNEKTESDHTREQSKDYLSGLVNLLRRNVNSSEILNVCIQEWGQSAYFRHQSPEEQKEIDRIIEQHNTVPDGKRDVLKDYESIDQILNKRRRL